MEKLEPRRKRAIKNLTFFMEYDIIYIENEGIKEESEYGS